MAAPRGLTIYPTASAALAALGPSKPKAVNGSLPWNPQRHSLNRFGYGVRPAELVTSFDPDQWWARQVAAPTGVDSYDCVPGLLAAAPCLALSQHDTFAWLRANTGNSASYEAMTQLARATLLLQVFSPNQLFESVVEFFTNHLNVVNLVSNMTSIRPTFDRDVIRAHSFGRFADMLIASSQDWAMQTYLTLTQSTASALNENYGRELLELHTVTPAAGYTQAEVVDSARIMTGRFQSSSGSYQFFSNRHWYGPVSVLGFASENAKTMDGNAVGDAYLDYLAHHPCTAANLATKLCVRYVSDTPSQALVAAVAQAYLDNDTAIVPMLSVIFRSSEFWLSRGLKWRRPIENLLATVRILGLQPSTDLMATGAALVAQATTAGQPPMGWPAPDGYPDTARSWRSATTMLQAWNSHVALASGAQPAAFGPPKPTDIYGAEKPATAGALVDATAKRLLGGVLTSGQRAAVLAYLGDTATTPFEQARSAANLPNLAATVLHSPQHHVR